MQDGVMKAWRELPGFSRRSDLMEQGLNSEADMLTNSETQDIIKLRQASRGIIMGKCQLFDMLPKTV